MCTSGDIMREVASQHCMFPSAKWLVDGLALLLLTAGAASCLVDLAVQNEHPFPACALFGCPLARALSAGAAFVRSLALAALCAVL